MTFRSSMGLLVLLVGCGGSPRSTPPPAPGPGTAGSPGAPGTSAGGTAGKPALELKDKDFVEGISNRDPFRSFLGEFNRPVRRVSKQQRKVILPRYALDELQLIAVITGKTRPRAMFRDPTGLGVTVKRGDYLSKNEGRVKQIFPDKVLVEIEEQAEDKNTLVDREIYLHPKEAEEEGKEQQRSPRETPEKGSPEKPPAEAPPEKASPPKAPPK